MTLRAYPETPWAAYVKEAKYRHWSPIEIEQRKFEVAQVYEFRDTAGWDFDPTQNGFTVLKRYRDSLLAKDYDNTKFTWYAEFFRRYNKGGRGCSVGCHVRKNKDTYIVMISRRKDAIDSYSNDILDDKTYECEFPNQYGWECFLKDNKIIKVA